MEGHVSGLLRSKGSLLAVTDLGYWRFFNWSLSLPVLMMSQSGVMRSSGAVVFLASNNKLHSENESWW